MKFSRTISDRSAGYDNNFNLLRMIAASSVLVSHAYPLSLGEGTPTPLAPILKGTNLGRVAVFMFFAISGFFIARSFSQKNSFRSFFTARILRLFPALAVMLAVTILVGGFFLTQAPSEIYWSATPEYFLHNLTLFDLQFELPGVFESTPYGPITNGSLWTLAYEVLCYVGVVLAGVLGLLGRPRHFVAAIVLLVLVCGVIGVFYGMHWRLRQLLYLGFPFTLGTLLWVWRSTVPLSWPVAGGLAIIAALAWPTPLFLPLFTVSFVYITFMLGYAQVPALLPYNRLGDYSYGMYIYAFPIQQIVASQGVTSPVMNMALAFPATLICAILSWHLIEKPFLRLRSKPVRVSPLAGNGLN
ncbi:acyltransferase family protein [Actibacterium sp. D379-3]